MQSFEDALAATAGRGRRCGIGLLLEALGEEERAKVLAALADETITHAHLARALSRMTERRVTPHTVSLHRAKECCRGSW